MQKSPGDIVEYARSGKHHCKGCVCHDSENSEFVNPGLSDYSSDVMFVTEEPKHQVCWDEEVDWEDWNEEFMMGYETAPGGEFMNRLLKGTVFNIGDVWIADSIKCPTKADEDLGTVEVSSRKAFDQCQHYLEHEIHEVDPELIITLGNEAGERTLDIMDHSRNLSILSDCGELITDVEPQIPVLLSPHWSAEIYYPDETERCMSTVQSKISQFFGNN